MFTAIKSIVLEPTVAFTEIDKKATVTQAAGIAIAVGLLRAVPILLDTSHPLPMGVTLIIAWKVASTLIMWCLLGLTGYVVGRQLLKGTGTFRATLIAVGFAGFVSFLAAISDIIFAAMNADGSFFTMLFFGWYSVLLFMGLREIHGIRTLPGLLMFVLVGVVGVALLFPLTPLNWLIDPLLTRDPFPPPQDTWTEAEVPATYANILKDPSFETEGKPPANAPPQFAQTPLPENWSPVRATCRLCPPRETLALSLVNYTCKQDASRAHTGHASALVQHSGLPIGTPLKWGWSQEGYFPALFERVVKNASKEDLPNVTSEIEKARRTTAICNCQPGQDVYFSVWMRGDDLTAATALLGFVPRPQQRPAGFLRPASLQQTPPVLFYSEAMHDTFNWTEVRIKAKVPKDAESFVVAVFLWGSGSLWIDDAQLLCEPGAAPSAPIVEPKTGLQELTPEEESPAKE